MIRHDFQCPQGHVTEKVVDTDAKGWETQPCNQETPGQTYCESLAERVFLSKRKAFLDKRIVIYRDGSGNVQFPGSADESMPKRLKGLGYERVEMDFHQARQFQKEFNSSQRAKDSDKKEFMHYLESEQRKEDREDLLAGLKGMSPRGRAYAEFVIEQANARDARAYYSSDPGFYIDVLES